MIGVIILALLLVSIMASASYSMIIMLEQNMNLIKAQEEKSNIQAIKIALSNSLMPIGKDNNLIAPMGDEWLVSTEVAKSSPDYSKVHQSLPSHLPVSKSNAWGNKYVYCPMGDSIDSPDFSTYGGLSFSNISVENRVLNPLDDSSVWTADSVMQKEIRGFDNIDYSAGLIYTDYAFGSDYLSENTIDRVLAVVISRRGNSDSSCFDLVYSNGVFSTSSKKDIVFGITRETSKLYQKDAPVIIDAEEFDSPSITSLNELLSKWDSVNQGDYTVNFGTTDNRQITSNITIEGKSSLGSKRVIVIDSNNMVLFENISGNKIIEFNNVSVYLNNVSFDNGVNLVFNNSIVRLGNTETKNIIEFNNSKVIFDGVVSQISDSLDGQMMLFNNSDVDFENNYLLDLSNGNDGSINTPIISFKNNSVATVGFEISADDSNGGDIKSSLISIDQTSSVSVFGNGNRAKIVAGYTADSIVLNKGSFSMINSDLLSNGIGGSSNSKANYGIFLSQGSVLSLSDSSKVGDSSTPLKIGVYDNGAKSISGYSSVEVKAIVCVDGYLFSNPDLSYPNTSKQMVGTMSFLNNKSEWRCL